MNDPAGPNNQKIRIARPGPRQGENMERITLDGGAMDTRAAMHGHLAEAFSLPAHYGRNLDALWDCLTERGSGAEVAILRPEAMPESLFAPLAALFLDLARLGRGWRFSVSSPAAEPGRYRHFKGGEYECLGMALHSETLSPTVVYRALYGSRGLWVRPAAMWAEAVETADGPEPRFARVEGNE